MYLAGVAWVLVCHWEPGWERVFQFSNALTSHFSKELKILLSCCQHEKNRQRLHQAISEFQVGGWWCGLGCVANDMHPIAGTHRSCTPLGASSACLKPEEHSLTRQKNQLHYNPQNCSIHLFTMRLRLTYIYGMYVYHIYIYTYIYVCVYIYIYIYLH